MLLYEVTDKYIAEGFFNNLYEGRLDFIQKQQGEKILERLRNDKNIPSSLSRLTHVDDPAKEVLEYIVRHDPSNNKKYTQWMVKMYLTGAHLDDMNKMEEYLRLFSDPKIQKTLDRKDINQYKNVGELFTAIESHRHQSNVSASAKRNVKMVIDKPHFKVLVPLDHAAACAWGEGTSWCTAKEDDADTFHDHHNEGPLYIIIDSRAGKKLRKYQMHFETGQMKNRVDGELSRKEIESLSEIPEYTEFLNKMIAKHYAPHVEQVT